MIRRYQVAIGIGALLAFVLLTTAFVLDSDAPPTSRTETAQRGASAVTSIGGYELEQGAASAAAFPGNELAVRGTVVGVDPARWNTPDGASPADPLDEERYVWTPVQVRVVEYWVRVGDVEVEVRRGDPIAVRHLGGTVGTDEFVVTDIPPLATYPVGTDVFLFLTLPVDAGDGFTAFTPNYVYEATPDALINAITEQEVSVPTMEDLLLENDWQLGP